MISVMLASAFRAYKGPMRTAEQNPQACCAEPETRHADSARTVSACLTHDHRVIDGILGDVEALVRERNLAAAAEAFVLLQTRLNSHIDLEEGVLFPVFEEVTACNGPTSVMRGEHADFRRLMTAVNASLQTPQHDEPLQLVLELARTLGSHNVKEERILYPKTDAGLSDAARSELVARIEALLE